MFNNGKSNRWNRITLNSKELAQSTEQTRIESVQRQKDLDPLDSDLGTRSIKKI